MKPKHFEVHFMGENVWTVDDQPHIFNSWQDAESELEDTFSDMDDADMDYEPDDYRIVEIDT
jgi:hypothetical protein